MTQDQNPDSVLEELERIQSAASARYVSSITDFVAEESELSQRVAEELERVKDPKVGHIEPLVVLATELSVSVQLVNVHFLDAGHTFIRLQQAFTEYAKSLQERIQEAGQAAALEVIEMTATLTNLMGIIGMGTDLASGQTIEQLMVSGELDERFSMESVIELHAKLMRDRSSLDTLKAETFKDIDERLIVMSAIRALVYELLADILERRLDLFRVFLRRLEKTRTGAQGVEGHEVKFKDGVAVVAKEGALAVAQEYLVRVLPAAATGGFPLISSLFAAAAAGQGVAEKRKHEKIVEEWRQKYRDAHDERNTAEDAYDLKQLWDSEDLRVDKLLREMSELPTVLTQM